MRFYETSCNLIYIYNNSRCLYKDRVVAVCDSSSGKPRTIANSKFGFPDSLVQKKRDGVTVVCYGSSNEYEPQKIVSSSSLASQYTRRERKRDSLFLGSRWSYASPVILNVSCLIRSYYFPILQSSTDLLTSLPRKYRLSYQDKQINVIQG